MFLTVVALWIAPSVLLLAGLETESQWLNRHFPEEIVALMAPVLLFLLPVDWRARRVLAVGRRLLANRLGHAAAVRRRVCRSAT